MLQRNVGLSRIEKCAPVAFGRTWLILLVAALFWCVAPNKANAAFTDCPTFGSPQQIALNLTDDNCFDTGGRCRQGYLVTKTLFSFKPLVAGA